MSKRSAPAAGVAASSAVDGGEKMRCQCGVCSTACVVNTKAPSSGIFMMICSTYLCAMCVGFAKDSRRDLIDLVIAKRKSPSKSHDEMISQSDEWLACTTSGDPPDFPQ